MFSLLSLLDDIASTLDDVAVMSKRAIQKSTALMSDDLAVNAGVVVGVQADRELPIVKSIFWGSLLNKIYCIAGVLVLSLLYPPLIQWIMFLGGLYLSYEGAHKVIEKLLPAKQSEHPSSTQNISEKEKINGAVRTDLILSIEIIVIAKSTLIGDFWVQVISLAVVGLIASILIYGLVAIIVKIDDIGLLLLKNGYKKTGSALVNSMPYTMKSLGIVGTLAMLLVGGGIISHTLHVPELTTELIQNLGIGFISGLILLPVVSTLEKLLNKRKIAN